MTDALAEDPNLVVLWAGYGFAKDYNKARGHAYTITHRRPNGPGRRPDADGLLVLQDA